MSTQPAVDIPSPYLLQDIPGLKEHTGDWPCFQETTAGRYPALRAAEKEPTSISIPGMGGGGAPKEVASKSWPEELGSPSEGACRIPRGKENSLSTSRNSGASLHPKEHSDFGPGGYGLSRVFLLLHGRGWLP